MPDNTIAQNLVIFSAAGPYTLTTNLDPTGPGPTVAVSTESNPLPAPPTTTSLQNTPASLIVNEVVGAQHY